VEYLVSETVTVLIVAPRGRFREGLQAVIRAVPWVNLVVCRDTLTAVSSPSATFTPTLTILDADILIPATDSGACAMPAKDTRLLVLISTAQQRSQAATLGADAVLLKGFPTKTLYRTMEALVCPDPSVSFVSGSPHGR